MIYLPDVTLIAVTGRDITAHWQALNKSSKDIEFGDIKLIEKHFDSIDDWSKYIVFNLTDHINTKFALLIHADGYVINPQVWNPDWLNYDFIGAPWPLPTDSFSYRDTKGVIQRVGNSVSLRSKRLLDLPKKIHMEWKSFHGFYNEDGFISVNMRHVFEENGCTFAPLDVAVHFSKEHTIEENKDIDKTFCFHSI